MLVPAVRAEEMRQVDCLAVEEFGMGLLEMMENAGRSLAENVLDMLCGAGEGVTVLAALCRHGA
jgi:NAD(P)H-hydrate epimerase